MTALHLSLGGARLTSLQKLATPGQGTGEGHGKSHRRISDANIWDMVSAFVM